MSDTPRTDEDVEMMKKVLSRANNSLFGSFGFFMSDRGDKPAHEFHLHDPIEKLKAYGNEQWQRAEKLERELSITRDSIIEECAKTVEEHYPAGAANTFGQKLADVLRTLKDSHAKEEADFFYRDNNE